MRFEDFNFDSKSSSLIKQLNTISIVHCLFLTNQIKSFSYTKSVNNLSPLTNRSTGPKIELFPTNCHPVQQRKANFLRKGKFFQATDYVEQFIRISPSFVALAQFEKANQHFPVPFPSLTFTTASNNSVPPFGCSIEIKITATRNSLVRSGKSFFRTSHHFTSPEASLKVFFLMFLDHTV